MLKGIGVSPGKGAGVVVKVAKSGQISYAPNAAGTQEEESARLAAAIEAAVQETGELADELASRVGEVEAMILRAQQEILTDPVLAEQIEGKIKAGSSAEEAAEASFDAFAAMFESSDYPQVRERAADVLDAKTRLLESLSRQASKEASDQTGAGADKAGRADENAAGGADKAEAGALPVGTVLVADEITPSMTAALDKDTIAAIITEKGGATSHAAILARALKIPAVLGVDGALDALEEGGFVLVDGEAGTAEKITEKAARKWQTTLQGREAAFKARRKTAADQQPEYIDGIPVYCNIGSIEGARSAREAGCAGIGLLRTEFLFLGREAAPTEKEQYEAYLTISEIMEGRPLTVRVLDIGGDKQVPYIALPDEPDPFLGMRGIRYLLQDKDLFTTQVRALLRANARYPMRILLPMVTQAKEMHAAQTMIKEEAARLALPVPPVGAMIETPAACLAAESIAAESDFFSIGTNDLTQFVMAAGRGNSSVADLYRTDDPAVLVAIRMATEAAHTAGIPVSMCGEAAGDPALVPVFRKIGIDGFSVTPAFVPQLREALAASGEKE